MEKEKSSLCSSCKILRGSKRGEAEGYLELLCRGQVTPAIVIEVRRVEAVEAGAMARISVLAYVVVLLLLLCSGVLGGRVRLLLGSAVTDSEARQPAPRLDTLRDGELSQFNSDVAEVLSKRLISGWPSPNGNVATLGRSLLGTGGRSNSRNSGQNAAPFVGRSLKSGRSGSAAPLEGQNTPPRLGASDLKAGSPSKDHNSVPTTAGGSKAARSSSLPRTPGSIGHKSAPTGSRSKHPGSLHKKMSSKFGVSFSSFAKSSKSPSPGAPSKGHNSTPLGGRKFSLVHERRTAEQIPRVSCAESHLNCALGTKQSAEKVRYAPSIPHVTSN